eukprot:g378.t1
MLEKCKADQILNMTLCRSLTYEFLLEDLEKLVRQKQCGPILIRLSWHDAGEQQMAANAGLQVAIKLLAPISAKYVPRLISHADLWVVAANVAIKVMGGPVITTRYGRLDAQQASQSAPSGTGRLPEPSGAWTEQTLGSRSG